MTSVLTKNQKRFYHKAIPWQLLNGLDGTKDLLVTVRFDDKCGNGHNTFSITGQVGGGPNPDVCGCIHDIIAEHMPELKPYLKWHLCSTDGPLSYIANTVYHAGDRDHWGLRKGERRQIKNGKTGKLAWILEDIPGSKYFDGDAPPAEGIFLKWVPWCHEGEGKERDLDAARSCAVWPDATDEELTAPGLADRLKARFPALMIEFRKAVES